MEGHLSKQRKVIELLLKVGALQQCKRHEEEYTAWWDGYDEAKLVGRRKIADREDGFDVFTPQELDEMIEHARNSHRDECPVCKLVPEP